MSLVGRRVTVRRRVTAGRAMAAIVSVTALFMTTTLLETPSSGAVDHQITMLAVGDSFSSGEGLADASGGCAQPSATGSQAYSQIAAQSTSAGVTIARPVVVLSCTGARYRQLIPSAVNPQGQWMPAIGRFDLVTFTYGGDDLDLADIIRQCIGLDASAALQSSVEGVVEASADQGDRLCPNQSEVKQAITDDIAAGYGDFLASVGNDMVTTGGNVVVLGYPEIVEDPSDWQGLSKAIGICMGIGTVDAVEVRSLISDLNAAIAAAVTSANAARPNGVHFTYLDVNNGGSAGIDRNDSRLFEPMDGAHHNLCSADSWINGLTATDSGRASFHPNEQAHEAEGSLLGEVVTRHLDWSTLGQLAPPPGPSASPSPTDDPRHTPRPKKPTPTPRPTTHTVVVPGRGIVVVPGPAPTPPPRSKPPAPGNTPIPATPSPPPSVEPPPTDTPSPEPTAT
ncbi:GDSL-like Lipase/Acylhydrolase family protein [Frankineae bacterium MT45]|nr:GDSL-like Lipase/Acylhydrolase family protein [Frankineae bacterium MT45]